MESQIKSKLSLISNLFSLTENPSPKLLNLIKSEIKALKTLTEILKSSKYQKNFKVIHTERKIRKVRYFLENGSTFVVSNDGKYKYFYDSLSKIITYEFSNGQIERTFQNGLKEIRSSDGTIKIKVGDDVELL